MRKIIAVYDNGGKTADRYTVVLSKQYMKCDGYFRHACLGLSDNPTSPLGFSQFSECFLPVVNQDNHMGKRVPVCSLPTDVQKHIKERLA